jgi:urea transport system substrate-binding protein
MFKKFVLILLVAALVYFSIKKNDDIIKVGVLHSLSGTMAISEKSVLDATLMAIDEVNKNERNGKIF